MLKVKLTENYGGVTISGDFNDFNELYDAISYFLKDNFDKYKNKGVYMMHTHVYGFLYDLRHAYQGDREYVLVDNYLNDSKMEWFKLKKKDVTENNIYYCFNYVLTDIFLDMLLMKSIISTSPKENDEFASYVKYFYTLVLNSLQVFLSDIKFNKVKRGVNNSLMSDKLFIPQWFDNLTIDYMQMDKKKRERKIMSTLDAFYNFYRFNSYYDMKKDVEKYSKENNCPIEDVIYKDYPEEIVW